MTPREYDGHMLNGQAPSRTRLGTGPALSWAAAACGLLCMVALAFAAPSRAAAATYDPLNIISYDVWRDDTSMTEAEIQAFLRRQPGVLDTLVTTDHAGMRKRASRIIAEAAQYWDVNPKIVLATLQKEQSLLSMRNPSTKRLREAMGCGIFPGSRNRYPGFGTQVWHGARKLSTYETDFKWRPGMRKEVSVRTKRGYVKRLIVPRNACTFALYTYTPYYPQKLFWDVYVRYFEDPRKAPRAKAVYRIVSKHTGAYLYTSSANERFAWTCYRPLDYAFDGVAFTVDTRAPGNTVPLLRLHNPSTGAWRYTTSPSERDALLSAPDASWVASGNACLVAVGRPGADPVFSLETSTALGVYLTTSRTLRAKLTTGTPAHFIDRGSLFGIDRVTRR